MKLAVSPPISVSAAAREDSSRWALSFSEKMSSSSSPLSTASVSPVAGPVVARGTDPSAPVPSPSITRVSLWVCLALVKSGTYSMIVEAFSRPYQRAGEPQMRRIAYLMPSTLALAPEMSDSGAMTLRIMQKRKSPTLLTVR